MQHNRGDNFPFDLAKNAIQFDSNQKKNCRGDYIPFDFWRVAKFNSPSACFNSTPIRRTAVREEAASRRREEAASRRRWNSREYHGAMVSRGLRRRDPIYEHVSPLRQTINEKIPVQFNRCSACTNCDIYVTANPRNQIFPGISNPFKESGESLKWISSKSNLTEPNLTWPNLI